MTCVFAKIKFRYKKLFNFYTENIYLFAKYIYCRKLR